MLVAVAHAWEPVMDGSRATRALYMLVYTFHMPAFILISGYFSRTFDMSAPKVKRLITGVAVPYVLFETAYPLFKRFVDGDPGQEISLLDPWYLTWFLVALFVWRLTTPVWKLVRQPLPLALGIAMLASASPEIGDDLDLQRVLQFLPFVLGLSMKAEHFHLVRRRSVRIASVPVFAAALAVGWWAVPRMNTAWFYHRDSAQELGAPWWAGPVMTLALFGCALAADRSCFFAWVPRRARCGSPRSAPGRSAATCCTACLLKAAVLSRAGSGRAGCYTPLGAGPRHRSLAAAAVIAACAPRPCGRALPVRDGAADGLGVPAGRGGR
ncbi:acyltransferase family protein [Streptomyces californicus]